VGSTYWEKRRGKGSRKFQVCTKKLLISKLPTEGVRNEGDNPAKRLGNQEEETGLSLTVKKKEKSFVDTAFFPQMAGGKILSDQKKEQMRDVREEKEKGISRSNYIRKWWEKWCAKITKIKGCFLSATHALQGQAGKGEAKKRRTLGVEKGEKV